MTNSVRSRRLAPRSIPPRWRDHIGYALRLAAIVLIVLLIHQEHRWYQAQVAGRDAEAVTLEQLRRFLPTAARVADWDPVTLGRQVENERGDHIGTVVQTSPDGDAIIGYVGPTNCLVVLDPQDIILGVEILSSSDTPDHVDDIRRDPDFLTSWTGVPWTRVGEQPIDTVSGATLTSLAIIDAVRSRTGSGQPSQRFRQMPTLDQTRRFFPDAKRIEKVANRAGLLNVFGVQDQRLGMLLRTSPAADTIVGYQGPTESVLALDPQYVVLGMWIGESYDSEKYVGYVREDSYFLESFNGLTLAELAAKAPDSREVEGVSGATMTSQAVFRGLVAAAQRTLQPLPAAQRRGPVSPRDWGTLAVLATGVLFCFTRLRSVRWMRVLFQVTLVLYFGFLNGNLLSIALLTGWAQNGIGWQLAPGLALLGAASLLVPIATKRQLYCQHLCPFGAAQQLLKKRLPWKVRVGRKMTSLLQLIPALLLGLTLCIAMRHWNVNLASLEPFNAFVFWIAGPATLLVAAIGLVAAMFVPMAYCRFGCPTGTVLAYLRRQGRSGRWRSADLAAVLLLALALLLRLT